MKSIILMCVAACCAVATTEACTAYDLIWQPGLQSFGGIEQKAYTSMLDCASACAASSVCVGVDWNIARDVCYFHENPANFDRTIPNPDVAQLRKPVPCN